MEDDYIFTILYCNLSQKPSCDMWLLPVNSGYIAIYYCNVATDVVMIMYS